MAHGGYGNRRAAERKPVSRRSSKGLGVEKKTKKKPKTISLKNQIRSSERMLLRTNLPPEVKEGQEKKLEELKRQVELQNRLALERKNFMRDRKVKFFERRKVETRLRRFEKLQRASSGKAQEAGVSEQLFKLKEDLEYVRFFPKNEKYVSLFMGGDDTDTVDRRNKLRKQIKANIVAAAASGKDLEETGSEDDGIMDMSEDDFFLAGSSSDEADADDEWTDKSAREQVSSASGKATSGMSSDEKNQKQISARALMRPPRPSANSFSSSTLAKSKLGSSSSKNSFIKRAEPSTFNNKNSFIQRAEPSIFNNKNSFAQREEPATFNRKNSFVQRTEPSTFNNKNSFVQRAEPSTFSNEASSSRIRPSFQNGGSSNSTTNHSSNLSSNSDAHKPRRKRRPKKKKQ